MAPCRIVFMGTPDFAVPALLGLLAHPQLAQVVAVVTQPDRPSGRGRQVSWAPVKACAARHDLAVLQPRRVRNPEWATTLAAFAADFFVVAAYGRILPQAVLDIPKLACLNIHASLLPHLRGASPIAHALWQGDTEAGVSLMQMAAGMDTGPVYSQRSVRIAPQETCRSLTTRLADLGAELLLQTLPSIMTAVCRAVPQEDAHATYAPLLTKNHGRLDWRQPASQLARQVRALDLWPGTFAQLQGRDPTTPSRCIGILQAHALPAGKQVSPGTVVAADSRGVCVACGEGLLCLDQVKPEGRGAMMAGAWVAGRSITCRDHFEVSLESPPGAWDQGPRLCQPGG